MTKLKSCTRLGLALVFALSALGVTKGQSAPVVPPAPKAYPDAAAAAVAEHLAKAKAIAGPELQGDYAHRCVLSQLYPARTFAMQGYMLIDPAKVFDNLYFVGQQGVSAWIVSTSQGLVLFDTLDNPDEAKTVIIGGMKTLGLDPQQIKYIIINHEHGDHFGGSTYIRSLVPSAPIMASKVAWAGMAAQKNAPPHPGWPAEWAQLVPDRGVHDLDITDGEKFVLGDTTLNFYLTPGHAPGTISIIFKVYDHGTPHIVAFYGGGGLPSSINDQRDQIASQTRFAELAKAAGADIQLANHQTQDGTLLKLDELKYRLPGAPHPYVIGTDLVQRYFLTMAECARVFLAREGIK